MKQSTAWVVSILASGAIVGGFLALLFTMADQDGSNKGLYSRSAAEVHAPQSPAGSEPETLSPDDP